MMTEMEKGLAARLTITFSDEREVTRVVDVPLEEKLEYLHLTILAAFELNAGELASFWMTERHWERSQEIPMLRIEDEQTGEESACMSDVPIFSVINEERTQLIYVYDMLLMWEFKIEWIESPKIIDGMDYPVLVDESGKMPIADKARAEMINSENSDDLSRDLLGEDGGYEDDIDFDSIDADQDDY